MNGIWLVIGCALLVIFGAAAVLPMLQKSLPARSHIDARHISFSQGLSIFGEIPLILVMLAASLLSGWGWGASTAWLVLMLVLGLMLMPLLKHGISTFDTPEETPSFGYQFVQLIFALAVLVILAQVAQALLTAFPGAALGVLIFLATLLLGRYTGLPMLILSLLALLIGGLASSYLQVQFGGHFAWSAGYAQLLITETTLWSTLFVLVLYVVAKSGASSGRIIVAASIGVLALLALLVSGQIIAPASLAVSDTINTERAPALAYVCLFALLPGLLPGTNRSWGIGTNFSSAAKAVTSLHLLAYLASLVIIGSLVALYSQYPLPAALGDVMLDPGLIAVGLIGHIRQTADLFQLSPSALEYFGVLIVVVACLELGLKLVRTGSRVFKTKALRWMHPVHPWLVGGLVIAACSIPHGINGWLVASISYAVLVIHELCKHIKDMDAQRTVSRFYMVLGLLLIIGITAQLIYFAVSSYLDQNFVWFAIAIYGLLFTGWNLVPAAPSIFKAIRSTPSSALDS